MNRKSFLFVVFVLIALAGAADQRAVVRQGTRAADGEQTMMQDISDVVFKGVELLPDSVLREAPPTVRMMMKIVRLCGLTRVSVFDVLKMFWLGIAVTSIEMTASMDDGGTPYGYFPEEASAMPYMKLGMLMPGIIGLMMGARGMNIALSNPNNALGNALGRGIYIMAAGGSGVISKTEGLWHGNNMSVLLQNTFAQYIPMVLIFMILVNFFKVLKR